MRPRARWWPLLVAVGLASLWLVKVWLLDDTIRQIRIVNTLVAVVGVFALGLVWLALFSGLPRRVRLAGVGGVILLLGATTALVRIRGVSGDLVPILGFRWEKADLPRPSAPPPPVLRAEAAPTPAAEAGRPPTGGLPPRASPPLEPPDAAPARRAAADYPQFLGPGRNGVVPGLRLARDWSAHPPRLVWRQPIGAGWSSFAVVGEQALTQEQRGDEELVVSYDVATGAVRWLHSDRARYATVIAGEGPRATPTVAGGGVYTMGATGILNALDLGTGQRRWRRDVLADNRVGNLEWGRSGSPLVVDDVVVVNAGGAEGRSLVAYDKDTGEPVWGGGGDGASYSSPLVAELAGRRQVVILNRGSVAGHDPATGALLWQRPWPPGQPSVAQPLPLPGDRLLVSAGYGIGSKLFRIAPRADGALEAALVWESLRLKSKFANFVFHDGAVYGLDDGVMTCLDAATGERLWKGGRYGHGQVLLVGDVLFVQTEHGEIVLVEPDRSAHRERARFVVLEGKTWNPPAIAGRHLLVRNEREAACYELPLED